MEVDKKKESADLFRVKIDNKTINISNYLEATRKWLDDMKNHIGSYGDIKLINAQDN